jgi:hypothetical protein
MSDALAQAVMLLLAAREALGTLERTASFSRFFSVQHCRVLSAQVTFCLVLSVADAVNYFQYLAQAFACNLDATYIKP